MTDPVIEAAEADPGPHGSLWSTASTQAVDRVDAAVDVAGARLPPPGERPDAVAALQLPAFRLFLAASLLSNIGNQMRNVAIAWDVYQRTGEGYPLLLPP